MKVGDLVRTHDGRVMVVVKRVRCRTAVTLSAIYTLHDGEHYPVYNLELVNESRETTQKNRYTLQWLKVVPREQKQRKAIT